jgi:hypothetical protein
MNKGRASALPTKTKRNENIRKAFRYNLRNTNGGIAMELNYEIDVKTRRGSYRTYKITFNGERHYENWCNAMEQKYGHKIIGEREIK